MWHIEEIPDSVFVEAIISLDLSQFGKGLPGGFNGQKEKGFSFFELSSNKYITSRITNEPILVAVTESQFKKWKEKKIVARAVILTYEEN